MDSVVLRAFLERSPLGRARLRQRLPEFVTHPEFLRLVMGIALDDDVSLYLGTLPLAAFNSNEPLWEQVEAWLIS